MAKLIRFDSVTNHRRGNSAGQNTTYEQTFLGEGQRRRWQAAPQLGVPAKSHQVGRLPLIAPFVMFVGLLFLFEEMYQVRHVYQLIRQHRRRRSQQETEQLQRAQAAEAAQQRYLELILPDPDEPALETILTTPEKLIDYVQSEFGNVCEPDDVGRWLSKRDPDFRAAVNERRKILLARWSGRRQQRQSDRAESTEGTLR